MRIDIVMSVSGGGVDAAQIYFSGGTLLLSSLRNPETPTHTRHIRLHKPHPTHSKETQSNAQVGARVDVGCDNDLFVDCAS